MTARTRRSRWRSGALVLVTQLAAFGLLLGLGPEQASACSCVTRAPATESEAIAGSDAVFIGTPTSRSEADPHTTEVTFTFTVTRVDKGPVGNPQVVSTYEVGGACGIGFVVGDEYRVFARRVGERLEANSCGYTHSTSRPGQYRPDPPPSSTTTSVPAASSTTAAAGAGVDAPVTDAPRPVQAPSSTAPVVTDSEDAARRSEPRAGAPGWVVAGSALAIAGVAAGGYWSLTRR